MGRPYSGKGDSHSRTQRRCLQNPASVTEKTNLWTPLNGTLRGVLLLTVYVDVRKLSGTVITVLQPTG